MLCRGRRIKQILECARRYENIQKAIGITRDLRVATAKRIQPTLDIARKRNLRAARKSPATNRSRRDRTGNIFHTRINNSVIIRLR